MAKKNISTDDQALQALKDLLGLNEELSLLTALKENGIERKIYAHNSLISHTGTTDETTVLAFQIAGDEIGPNGNFEFNWDAHIGSAGQTAEFRIYFNNTVQIAFANLGTNTAVRLFTNFYNTGAVNTNKSGSSTSLAGSLWAATTSAFSDYAVNTAAIINVKVTIKLISSSENRAYIDKFIVTAKY